MRPTFSFALIGLFLLECIVALFRLSPSKKLIQASSSLPPREEEDQSVSEALNMVKQQAFFMKQAIDKDDVDETLKCASGTLIFRELRTGLLTQNYYELDGCLQRDEASAFFSRHQTSVARSSVLYQRVQYAETCLAFTFS